ncbi:MAG: UDP-N-acetylglucosamine--N-acetylmuramyl-(pentapeptide) pyrophosphoryl-undecaprenol N-acetylglucosamine transferase [Candidatus Nanopelagicaceae bacterium]|nr:UDP-N-acetylglucosamine--N-acetylmuramyl-(pentapeptide) pyrophosphoryl-undecaprenol N-acetylglucosamine transferase [Candidatus Nanopelagicaceae bacterium]
MSAAPNAKLKNPPVILFAGGGTAGHIEPALAVADEIRKIRADAKCAFLGTDGALEALLVPKRGYSLHTIKKVVLPRSLDGESFLFPFRLVVSTFQAIKALRGVDLLIGFGGYVAAPAYLAAFLKGVPIVIHEANAKPGWANKLGRGFAKLVAVNFEAVRKQWPGAVLTGMPIRSSLNEVAQIKDRESFKREHCRTWGLDPKQPLVAIFGGSQGSQYMNGVVAQALPQLSGIQIIHAVGMNNQLPDRTESYLPLPYFHDMTAIYGSADLVIARSGAVTCSELASVGKFSILVPLPHGNGEQIDNAKALEGKGAAVMVKNEEFTASWLIQNLSEALVKAGKFKSTEIGSNSAAGKRIAELALGVLEPKSGDRK